MITMLKVVLRVYHSYNQKIRAFKWYSFPVHGLFVSSHWSKWCKLAATDSWNFHYDSETSVWTKCFHV